MSGNDASLAGSIVTTQTTVDLFELLRKKARSDPELRRIRDACAVALSLFAGRFHASGKVYVAHCMGSAGALASLGASTDLVVAGLTHGAYRWGDFGAWGGTMKWKRYRLRRFIGPKAELYVHRFNSVPWSYDAVCSLRRRLPALDAIDGDVVLMRLSSELDSLASGGRFCTSGRRERMLRKGPRLVEIAADCGFPALAAALAAACAQVRDESVEPGLELSFQSGLIPPESSTKRIEARFGRLVRDTLRRARHLTRGESAEDTPAR